MAAVASRARVGGLSIVVRVIIRRLSGERGTALKLSLRPKQQRRIDLSQITYDKRDDFSICGPCRIDQASLRRTPGVLSLRESDQF